MFFDPPVVKYEKEGKAIRRQFHRIAAAFPWIWQIASHWTHDRLDNKWVRIDICSLLDVFDLFLMSPPGDPGLRLEKWSDEQLPVVGVWLYQEGGEEEYRFASRCNKIPYSETKCVAVAMNELLMLRGRTEKIEVGVMYLDQREGALMESKHRLRIFTFGDRFRDRGGFAHAAVSLIHSQAARALNPE